MCFTEAPRRIPEVGVDVRCVHLEAEELPIDGEQSPVPKIAEPRRGLPRPGTTRIDPEFEEWQFGRDSPSS